MSSWRRREVLALGAAGLAGCTPSRAEYFGSTALPAARALVHTLPGEPETLDPALSTGSNEFWVILALLEGLTQYHPRLPQPMAALAKHYAISSEYTRLTFCLRGHPVPTGMPLPNANDLAAEFTGGRRTASDRIAARWSAGRPITAHDFVYSWRRLLDPKTAAPLAYQLFCVLHAQEVYTGKRSPEELGVRALDDFTFQVDLQSPTPFFLHLITQYLFNAVSRHAIEEANATTGVSERMRRLADCEKLLLRAMPILPLYHNVSSYLRKPYVHGVEPRRLGLVRFKYGIDRNWRTA